ncbi:MAG: hypothetical protein WD894_19475 [Pirellulales bacterium]
MFGFFFGLNAIDVAIIAFAAIQFTFVWLALRSRRREEIVLKLSKVVFDLTAPLPMSLRPVVCGTVGGLIIVCLTFGPILFLMWFW